MYNKRLPMVCFDTIIWQIIRFRSHVWQLLSAFHWQSIAVDRRASEET